MCFRPATASANKDCPECGASIDGSTKVCPKCGAGLPDIASALIVPGAPKSGGNQRGGIPGAAGASRAPVPPAVPKSPGAPKPPTS